MRLDIDTKDKHFTVTKAPEAKTEAHSGTQRVDRDTNDPLWSTQVLARDDTGGEIINITTAGEKPDVEPGEEVDPIGLYASPWTARGDRRGVAYQAAALEFREEEKDKSQ